MLWAYAAALRIPHSQCSRLSKDGGHITIHSTPEEDFLRPNILDNFLPKVDFVLPSVLLLLLDPLKLLVLPLHTPPGVLALRALLPTLELDARAPLVGVVADLESVVAVFGWLNRDLASPCPEFTVLAGAV